MVPFDFRTLRALEGSPRVYGRYMLDKWLRFNQSDAYRAKGSAGARFRDELNADLRETLVGLGGVGAAW
jgi:hypothetical protein